MNEQVGNLLAEAVAKGDVKEEVALKLQCLLGKPLNKQQHYFRDVRHLQEIDVYRVLDLFNVVNPCIAHAIKKLLAPGQRGHKGWVSDIQEAILALQRALEMKEEDVA
jgi:hypothetical protein